MVPVINMNSYDSARGTFVDALKNVIPQNQTEEALTFLKVQCGLGHSDTVEIPMQEQNLTVNCTDIMKANTAADLYDIVGGKLFEQTYYKSYNCSFFNCIKSGQSTVFFSEYGHNYMKSLLNYMYVALALSAALLLISSDIPFGAMKNFGISMIFVGVSYFFTGVINQLMSGLLSKVPAQLLGSAQKILEQINAQTSEKLFWVFIIGVVLAIVGIVGGLIFKPGKKKEKEESKK